MFEMRNRFRWRAAACAALVCLHGCHRPAADTTVPELECSLTGVATGTRIRCVQTEASSGIPDIDFVRLDGDASSIWLVNGVPAVNLTEHEDAVTGEGRYEQTTAAGRSVEIRFTFRLNLERGRLYLFVHPNGETIEEPGLPGLATCHIATTIETA